MPIPATAPTIQAVKTKRIESIDLLRGIVMIIMALDHVRDYFHGSAYLFDPTDLSQTSPPIFFTRWITHFCAPVFMLLAGVSAFLYGAKRSRKELSFFLLTRGVWLLLAELFLITLGWSFNPHYPVYILQVIWAFGISMIVLSALIYLDRRLILFIGILLVGAHNLLDQVHVPGTQFSHFLWAALHEQSPYSFGPVAVFMGYPIIPWIGIIALGYCLGGIYTAGYDPVRRKKNLISLGLGSIALFILLRSGNFYGDHAHWSVQKNGLYSSMSFLNTTKYPPSLLYVLMTLGPSLLFLAFAEKPLNALTQKITVFGRVPMFFYILHIYFIHLLAIFGATLTDHKWTDMILTGWVTANPQLRGYGFSLAIVYLIWIGVMLVLYPLCRSFDRYKRANQARQKWLSYF
ncbi:DUF1624 domain-containing protein [Flavitalea flava]